MVDRPDLRGLVLEAYGAGNGPTDAWFLDPLREAVDRGVTVVVTTQCRAGSVHGGLYATGAALLSTGAIPGGDMTFEAALTKLIVLADRLGPDELRARMQDDLAGELTVAEPRSRGRRCRHRMVQHQDREARTVRGPKSAARAAFGPGVRLDGPLRFGPMCRRQKRFGAGIEIGGSVVATLLAPAVAVR